ncbi:MAG: hypothetical protein FWG72_04580 [Oscillospiraceae bacterium]|nr:hypothetical protein [Oscillospiraceae bacterium]
MTSANTTNPDMSAIAREYRELQAMIRELQEEADAKKQIMVDAMDTAKVEELAAGEYTIRYTVYESSRLDSAKLKADHAGLYAAYTKPTVATRFQVA